MVIKSTTNQTIINNKFQKPLQKQQLTFVCQCIIVLLKNCTECCTVHHRDFTDYYNSSIDEIFVLHAMIFHYIKNK